MLIRQSTLEKRLGLIIRRCIRFLKKLPTKDKTRSITMLLRAATLEKLVLVYPKSLISDYYKVFGVENTDKLLTIFSGMSIRVPSTKDVERALRDIAIHDSLIGRDTIFAKQQRAHLSEVYHISLKKVRKIFRRMKRVMSLSARMKESEAAVGIHKIPKRIKESRARERRRF